MVKLTKEEKLAKRRAYRKANRPKENAYARKYRAKPERHEKHKAKMRGYYHKNKEAIKQRNHERWKHDPSFKEQKRAGARHSRYGVTREDFARLLSQQGGLCAICRGMPTGKRDFCIDHDHATGSTRGILCSNCNTALGLLRDNVQSAKNLLLYLEHYRCLNSLKIA